MGFQSIDKNLHRIVAPQFESAHDGHEKRLGLPPSLTAICENVLADQNSRTDRPLLAIVIRRQFFVIKECEQFVSMPTLCPFLLSSTAFRPRSVGAIFD
jgi:hypothetical protein